MKNEDGDDARPSTKTSNRSGLPFVHQIGQREVQLQTVIGGKLLLLVHHDRGFTVKAR